jgi:hypothetical protein
MTPTLMLALSYFGVPVSSAVGTVLLQVPKLFSRTADRLVSLPLDDVRLMHEAIKLRSSPTTREGDPRTA